MMRDFAAAAVRPRVMRIYMIPSVFSCRMVFFLLGFYVGNWTIRIPDIKAQVNTSYAGMGLNFMAFAAGAVIMMVISSWVIRRLTTRRAIFYSAWFIAAGFIGIPFAAVSYTHLTLPTKA